MKVKRIFAPDMRQAMKRVRDEIGPEAVIVSNHRIAGGVEVVAAHEQDFDQAQTQFKRDHSTQKRRESQIDILATPRKTVGTVHLEQQKEVAKNALLSARGRGVSQYAETATNNLERNKQVNSSYDDELESILASLKKKKDGQRGNASVPAGNVDLIDEPSIEQPINIPVEEDLLPEPKGFEQVVQNTVRQSDSAPKTKFPAGRALRAVAQKPSKDEQEGHVIDDMQREIEQLKKMLASQLPGAYRSSGKTVANDLVADKLSGRFEQIGLQGLYEERIAKHIDPGLDINKAWRRALAKLVDLVPVFKQDFIQRSGMIAFVGPTGVGKTTTIGKLAAKYVLENGSAGVALVTTDSYRIAAHEQLKTYGRILDVPVRVVDEKNSLTDVLASLQNKRLVLIDTAGLGAGDDASQEQNWMLESVPMRLKKLLVLSCSSQKNVLDDAYDNYQGLGLDGCILTKVDESGSMGAALSLVAQRELPVAYVTSGQKVPDDIEVAQKNDLVSRAVLAAQKSREREKIRRNASI